MTKVSVQFSKQNRKYIITYCNTARFGLSHVHRAQKFGRVVFELCKWTDKQTDRQTYSSQHFAPLHLHIALHMHLAL